MLEEFIKEYKQRYILSFKSDFEGKFKNYKAHLLEPKLHPSSELCLRLNSLNALLYEPMQIAVIGQFSSGKSTFLNALLGFDILPTGVVPVTAKPTFIKYNSFPMLKATYNDNREEYMDVSILGEFVDQRKEMRDVKFLSIYSNSEILKYITFVDTPGLNSISDADTSETMDILNKVGAIIWITLIDNAGRKSELEELNLIPQNLRKNSICLLNQKDKLTKEEIENVLIHSKSVYGKVFDTILAISSKMELKNEENSGFVEVKEFLSKDIVNKKECFIKNELELINVNLQDQYGYFIKIYEKLSSILDNFLFNFDKKIQTLLIDYLKEFISFYAQVKDIANLVSDEISTYIEDEKRAYFVEEKNIIGSKIRKIVYTAPTLNSDKVLSSLIYSDDKLSKIFKKFRLKLNSFHEKIKADIDILLDEFKNEILMYKGEFESIRKNHNLHSDVEFAYIRKFASEVVSLFFNDYQKAVFEFNEKNDLFFDKITIKIATNYESAIKQSVWFLSDKIQRFISDYESDPVTFSLYYPKKEEILSRILINLNYFEFENDFIGNKTFIKKNVDDLMSKFVIISNKNLDYINSLKNKNLDNINYLNGLKSIL
ncbi:dynamin family protein [Campylobacter sputorum]|uniref:dynamin family protein n=1 Tax=Campylobacter sputorum TaxID=206 RepID=UPI000B791B07|nr:dynamin family protein [Campylobacter sputorum]ASM36479.1 GTP-binding protein (dynamin domain) [Campylobacter sputorum bv. faecalis CCUG 20703]